MRIKEVEYSRLFSFGNYQNERIGFKAEIDENENPDAALGQLFLRVLNLNKVFQRHREILENIERTREQIKTYKDDIKLHERYLANYLKEREELKEEEAKGEKSTRLICRIEDVETSILREKREIANYQQKIVEAEREILKLTSELETLEEKIRRGDF